MNLDRIVEREIVKYKERMDVSYLECAVSLLVTDFGIKRTIEILEKQVKNLEDFG